jgi:hypothetical protein
VKPRSLLLAHRLKDEVLAVVPHRQWVFTIPKRLRVYFRYDREVLGKLCRAAYDTVRDVYGLEVDGDCGVPAMVGAVQTFGDLIHWHSHIHAIVAEGVFTSSGHFVHIPCIWLHRATEIWQDKVFDLLLDACKIDHEVVANMRGWKHSGFSVDFSVCIKAGDHAGMQRLVEYIARCPFSLGRMIMLSGDGKVFYRAGNPLPTRSRKIKLSISLSLEIPEYDSTFFKKYRMPTILKIEHSISKMRIKNG